VFADPSSLMGEYGVIPWSRDQAKQLASRIRTALVSQ
jgi:hypothetical protein